MWAFDGLAKWVDVKLSDILSECHHIVGSTEAFVKKLRGVRVHDQHFMVSVDIEEFYMSGECAEVAADASRLFAERSPRELMREVLEFLLGNQYIESDLLPERLWHVQLGSGMGMRHSGAVSDAALFVKCEQLFAVRAEIMKLYGIDMFVRLKDDVWLLCHDRKGFHEYFQLWKRKAGYYRLKCVELSRTKVTMLQVDVQFKDSRIIAMPKFKTASLGPPLHHTSSHPAHVHRSWPAAVIQSFGNITLTVKEANDAKHTFIERLKQYRTPSKIIQSLQSVDPIVVRQKDPAGKHRTNSWIVIPYHPAWSQGNLTKSVRYYVNDPGTQIMHSGVCDVPRLRIAWRNGSPYAMHVIRQVTIKPWTREGTDQAVRELKRVGEGFVGNHMHECWFS